MSLRRNITHKCAAGYVYATLHLSTATSIAKNKKKIHNKIKANTMKSRLSVCALTSMLHALTAIMLTVLHTYVDCISYHIMHWLIILERITKIAGMCIVCIFILYYFFFFATFVVSSPAAAPYHSLIHLGFYVLMCIWLVACNHVRTAYISRLQHLCQPASLQCRFNCLQTTTPAKSVRSAWLCSLFACNAGTGTLKHSYVMIFCA